VKPALRITEVLLVLTYCIFSLFFNVLGGAAIISGAADNYRCGACDKSAAVFWTVSGTVMAASSVVMLAALVLAFKKKVRSAAISETAGLAMCMTVLFLIVMKASETGMTNSDLVHYRDVYISRHLPAAAHSFLLYLYLFAVARIRKNK